VKKIFGRVLSLGSRPDDSADDRLQKRVQVTMALASIPAIGLWALTFWAMDHPWIMLWHAGYCAVTIGMIIALAFTKSFDWFRWAHPALVALAPFALHIQLGGYRGSGGAFLWPMVAPMATIIVLGAKRSLAFFLGLCGLFIAGLLRDGPLAPSVYILSPAQISIQFAFNTIGVAGFIYLSTRYFVARIDREKARAERLLHNILPDSIAERLKRDEGVIADRFDGVTVLFSDIAGFTPLSAKLPPHDLVMLLDEIFSGFDRISERYGLEKIKTIGDAYMAVGGLPTPATDHAARVADAALAMRDFVAHLGKERGLDLAMRIGLHSGEVVAGVIGKKKFSYDLWGDTVNIASRMESHGAPGRIHMSGATRLLLGDAFMYGERGDIDIKGKGEMRTYWLEARATVSDAKTG
jgi:guanylate cyclase